MERVGKRLLPLLLIFTFFLNGCTKTDPVQALEKYLLEESTLSQTAWEYYIVQQTSEGIVAYIIFPKRKPGVSRRAPIEDELRNLCPDKSLHSFWQDTGLKSFDFILIKNVDKTRGKAKRLLQITCHDSFDLLAHQRGDSAPQETQTSPVTFENASQWYQQIIPAIRSDEIDRTAQLASSGKQYIDTRDETGQSVLHRTISADVARLLIENGAVIDAKTDIGRTPLIYATEHNTTEFAELLIQHGANVNHVDNQNVTPLKRASSKAMAKLLVAHGARVPETALHIPAGDGRLELVKYLHSQGGKIDSLDSFGQTPLHSAASRSYSYDATEVLKTAQWLLEQGIEINHQDRFGRTAYDLVLLNSKPNQQMLKLLESYGGKPGKK